VRTDLKGWEGKSALDLAREYHYDEIAALLGGGMHDAPAGDDD